MGFFFASLGSEAAYTGERVNTELGVPILGVSLKGVPHIC